MITFSRRQALPATLLLGIFLCHTSITRAQNPATPAPPPGSAALTVGGDIPKSLTLSFGDLKNLPRTTVHVKNEHAGKDEVYEGVALSAILKQAGVPQGSQIRGKVMATYILAGGSDGYLVLFSLPELDSDFEESEVLVADTMDGAPIPGGLGPLRLVVPHDKRPARWVRMFQSIQVVKVSK